MKWQWRKKKTIPKHFVCKPCSLDSALSHPSFGHWPCGSVPRVLWAWGRGWGTYRHHDPSVSFGALETIQSWATLKPTEDVLVNPLPTGQPGPRILSHIQSEEHRHLQVVRGSQILLCVLAVLWAPRGKTNTISEKKRNSRAREIGGTPPAFMGRGNNEPLTGGRRAGNK